MATGSAPIDYSSGNIPAYKPRYPLQTLYRMVREPMDLFSEAASLGDIVRLSGGRQETYLLNHPDLIRDVLVTNHRMFHKSPILRRMGRLLGQGLLTSEDELHLRQRRLIAPAFHRARVAEYAQLMTGHAQKVMAGWRSGETRDMHHEMMRLTMLTVAAALFGSDVEKETEKLGEAISILIAGARRVILPFWEKIEHLPLPSQKRINEARLLVDHKIRAMIAERRALLRQGGEMALRHDLLDMLLRARDEEGDGKGMSDEQVRDEVMTLFLAGHETTANVLAWTLYLLSQHPGAEGHLVSEVHHALGGRIPTAEDTDRLPYARMVLSESMRMYPPAWTISREALQDYPAAGLIIPKGSVVIMSQWVSHHDPRYFPDPYRFDPQRWTPEAAAARPKFAYYPFGGGPRLCVGEPFAWMESILILAMLVQHWQFRLQPGFQVVPNPQVTLRPKYGLRMILTERD